MEVLHIIWWSIIAVAAIGFMFIIKPLADLLFPLEEDAPKESAVRPTWLCKED